MKQTKKHVGGKNRDIEKNDHPFFKARVYVYFCRLYLVRLKDRVE